MVFFFFSSRRRHTIFDCDWSSDVCSSDLRLPRASIDFAARVPVELAVTVDSRNTAEDTTDPQQPVVDKHRHLLSKAFLETEADQVASGEFQKLRRPSSHGHQATAGSPANAADCKD